MATPCSKSFAAFLSFFILLGVSSPVTAQRSAFALRGKVFDAQTQAPVPLASVYVEETLYGTTTDINGTYQIRVPSLPAILVVSCVGYTRRYFSFTQVEKSEFNIPLTPSLNEIPEVLITAKKTPISISDEQDIYVTDYEFYDNHILLLGHPGKRSTETLLVLMDRMGKRILKKEIVKGRNLYRDPFNNVHLLTADTAYQVFYDGHDIQLLYPSNKERFMASFPEFLEIYHNRVILRQYDYEDQALMYYFYNPADSTIDRFWAAATPEILRRFQGVKDFIRITPSGKGSSRFNLFNADERFIKMAFYAPIFCPLEVIRDTIYIFNFTLGVMETFGPKGRPIETPTLMTFQTQPGWQKKLYLDPVRGKVYTEYLRGGISELREINIKTGTLTDQLIKIPQFDFLSNLMVQDGFLYFLYEEKYYPKFMRLYRMAI